MRTSAGRLAQPAKPVDSAKSGSSAVSRPWLQRACKGECSCCRGDANETLQRSVRPPDTQVSAASGDEAPAIVHDVLRSPGQPLDFATRTSFERRFGHDFSKVRIHADSQAARSA